MSYNISIRYCIKGHYWIPGLLSAKPPLKSNVRGNGISQILIRFQELNFGLTWSLITWPVGLKDLFKLSQYLVLRRILLAGSRGDEVRVSVKKSSGHLVDF